ncbi:NAD-dependent succinate-semialdehyde dehydrogenase [Rhodococcus sp. 14C212]|uniref:NAD-dependent succinate-semialdehyde dehydrogenase n=1 Tax=Rhodococcus sp. 14C212 TaxID=2711209 RepID=UPI001F0FC120|nr:NAD-dependent succinate-semialdehyde dehydrogenase [Rhodococcus sp. 14C212]
MAQVPGSLFLGGEWTPAASGATFSVEDPATGRTLAQVADGGVSDAGHAIAAAADAQEDWMRSSPRERSDVLRSVFEMLIARTDEVSLLMSAEMGKPIREARAEVAYGAEFLRWFSEEAVRIAGRFGPSPSGSGQIVVSKRPVGPCYLITPWNFPLAMATRKIAPALAAGCTAIVKPASLTPLTTLYLAKLFEEAGLPAGVLNVLTSRSSGAVSDAIIGDSRLRKVSFTGSTPVGVALMEKCAKSVLRVSMELGGNAPFVVFGDADLDRAVDAAIVAKYRNTGQACTAANRFFVHRSVVESFAERLGARTAQLEIGRGCDESTDVGPLIDAAAVANTAEMVEDAVAGGAKICVGGRSRPGPGYFFEPTVMTEVPAGARVLREEIFGPVAAIVPFDSEAEAVELANDTEYGLVSYVFTRDLDRGMRMIDALDTGMMGLNTGLVSDPSAPFGGVKQSGMGREGGAEGIEEYLETKYTLVARR